MQQLSVGNVVNVSLNLYRANFKLYLKLSLFAYLWLLVPLYGWAKFLAISALISRLAFCELMGQPESVKDANRYVRPRTLSFLLTAILLVILLFAVLLISFILTGLFLTTTHLEQVIAPLEIVSDERFVRNNILTAVFFLVLLVLVLLFFLACLFIPTVWLYSRFFITELPLASENKVNLITTIWRSWRLTSKVMAGLISSYPLADSILGEMFSWGITLLNAVMIMPLFQLIKAVVYYNLRLRREGLDLRLRDRYKL